MEKVNIGKIKELINQRNISQYELADRSGVSQSTISKHLQNGDFGVTELLGIADALEVSIKDLFEKEDKFRIYVTVEDLNSYTASVAAKRLKEIEHFAKEANFVVHSRIEKVERNEQERLF